MRTVAASADMGQHYWGCLYDERQHKLLAGPTKEDNGSRSAATPGTTT